MTQTMRREGLIYVTLFLITAAVYWPVVQCGFISIDDPDYVTGNAFIQQGLTPAGVAWAWGAIVSNNWHPVTCLSHMLDCDLFGLDAAAHHVVNLLFHLANTLLLFHVLKRMTGELRPAALVAALFALHPLHVESVAWISERKDVLSTFFGLLTIWAYADYTQASIGKLKSRKYLLAILFFTLGLMSKPMLVTWPFVLLLLDIWPLKRVSVFAPRCVEASAPGRQRANPGLLVREKLPFFALAITSSVITFNAQRLTGAVVSLKAFTVSERLGSILVSYFGYLGKTIWPSHLTLFYPYPSYPHPVWPAWQVIGSAVLLAFITSAALWQIRDRPYFIVGWLWFLGTLVPVIGLVQVGTQPMADRYSYIPQIGLLVMIVWGLNEYACRSPGVKPALCAAALAALAACSLATSRQLRYWRNTETLFRHALSVTTNNPMAQMSLGNTLFDQGQLDEALLHLKEALRLGPSLTATRWRVAAILARQGKIQEEIALYRETIRNNPDLPEALNDLAWILATTDDPGLRNGAEAIRHAEKACALTRYQTTVIIGTLAAAYAEAGRYDDAVRTAERAIASATASGKTELVERNRQLLELYRAGKPYHERPANAAYPGAE